MVHSKTVENKSRKQLQDSKSNFNASNIFATTHNRNGKKAKVYRRGNKEDYSKYIKETPLFISHHTSLSPGKVIEHSQVISTDRLDRYSLTKQNTVILPSLNHNASMDYGSNQIPIDSNHIG